MRKNPRLWGLAAVLVIGAALASTVGIGSARAAAVCDPTGLSRDGINLTARLVNPTTPVTGIVDATGDTTTAGCNIGVYYGPGHAGSVSGADIFGANYYGVVVNAASVNVTATIHDIGENPLNGSQHGVGVLYTTVDQAGHVTGPSATGTLSGTTITKYQKGGVVISGSGAAVTVQNNTVTGQGAVDYIAQNGIQVSYGAKAAVTGNTVTGNAYTGAGGVSSAGILVVGGPGFTFCAPDGLTACPYTVGLSILKNTVTNNDVGVWLFNAAADFGPPSTATNESVKFNTISNDAVTNTSGDTATCGYQAGISDLGKKDLIVNNSISGIGYTPQVPDCGETPAGFLRLIDLTTKARGVPSNK